MLVKSRGLMDHHPLLLSVPMQVERFIKPFQFFNYMTNLKEFRETVIKSWDSTWFGNPIGILCRKLKIVKKDLVALNKKHGNAHNNVYNARAQLHSIQDQISANLMFLDTHAAQTLDKLLLEEEALLLQKSRVKWLELGDGNSSFFFNKTKANWNSNKILAIENADGEVVFGHNDVASVVVDYFKNSIGTSSSVQWSDFEDLECNVLTEDQASLLEQPVNPSLIL